MIESLRRKVFWSILLSAAGVLLAILLAINVLALAQSGAKEAAILDSAMMLLSQDRAPEGEPPFPDRRGGRDRAEVLRSMSGDELGALALDAEGAEYLRVGCAETMEEETLSALLAAARADADGLGRAGAWRYRVVDYQGGSGLLILNAASLRRERAETALLSLAGFAAACCLFALLAHLLSRAIVRPVEENVKMQKRFVADASHELKTPLTVIDANAAVLEQSVGRSKWLDYIREQTNRMAGLVNELLQLANLEETTQSAAPRRRERFDAAEAVLTAALPFESVAFERGVALETELPERIDAVGSAEDLEQLAAILIDNAVKHADAGGTVRVTAAPARGHRGAGMLELRVSNPGPEIPPEALPHIFDRFYRVDESRAHSGNSYGLGLAIARGLAEKNKGSLTAASGDGVTVFTLLFPLE